MKRTNLGDRDHRQVQEAPDPDHDQLVDQEQVRGQVHVHQPKIGLHGPDQGQDQVHQPKIGGLHRVHAQDQNQPPGLDHVQGLNHVQDRNLDPDQDQDRVQVPDQVRQRVRVLRVHQVQTKAK